METRRETGSLKSWLGATRGYGFIAPTNGGASVFLHRSHITSGVPEAGRPCTFVRQRAGVPGRSDIATNVKISTDMEDRT
jgi:cold shock CspA family protein